MQHAPAVGLLDATSTDDLEQGAPGRPGPRQALAEAGLVTLTAGGAPSLRTVSYHPIVCASAAHRTRCPARLSAAALHRRAEQQFALATVRALGHEPAGREVDGRFHSPHYESQLGH
ncbi:hypothetical protein SRB17_25100 [Streptomyces sp. RB17]|nr:hypothetical protein [Streptomyces sp. RB17]